MTKDDNTKQMNDLMNAMQEAGFKSMAGVGTQWLETMSEMGSEMASFTAARIKEDVATQQKLLNAKGIDEVQKIQTQFFEKAMKDYRAETAKLLDMGKELAPKSTDGKKS